MVGQGRRDDTADDPLAKCALIERSCCVLSALASGVRRHPQLATVSAHAPAHYAVPVCAARCLVTLCFLRQWASWADHRDMHVNVVRAAARATPRACTARAPRVGPKARTAREYPATFLKTTLQMHTKKITHAGDGVRGMYSVCVTADGNHVVTGSGGSGNNTARIWLL